MRRGIDVVLSLGLLVVLSPLLGLAAVAVALSSPGPILYRAQRVGRGGRTFAMLKFRTMVVGADRIGPGITARHDPRLTPVGGLLRATKLDELPQLWNVVAGDMSLIGPRAESPKFVAYYTPEQRRLLDVRPGVTGPGQLYYTTDQQGLVDDVAQAEQIYVERMLHDKLQLDLQYLQARGVRQDLKILLKTAQVVIAAVASGLFRRAARRERQEARPHP